LKNNSQQLKQMSLNGRKFVEKYYNREKQAEKLESELLKLMEEL